MLASLVQTLRAHPNVAEKLRIYSAYRHAVPVAGGIDIGDDTAAIPDGDGYLLLAAEGMIEAFIERDPWFAGYCAVMVNLSDIAAMGGWPIALVDVLWTHPSSAIAEEIWAGMRAASEAYHVPIVGGHTTRYPIERTPLLAMAVLGKARHLITSFSARPGDRLIMAVDLRGAFRGEGTLFWNASVDAPPERLRRDLALLPKLAELGLVTAGKDISNGGVAGTLGMLLATSRCGATLDVTAVPRPEGVDLARWLLCFPSYGYLLTAKPENVAAVRAQFTSLGIAAAEVGVIEEESVLALRDEGNREVLAAVDVPEATETLAAR